MGEAAMVSGAEGACHGQAVVQQLLAHAIPDKVHPVPPPGLRWSRAGLQHTARRSPLSTARIR